MNNNMIRVGALTGAIAVMLGAFGAHALKAVLDAPALANWETACRYQFYHALAIVFTGLMYMQHPTDSLKWTFRFFLTGMILFCGSLYLLSLRSLLDFSVLWLGPVTPLGGLSFIAGWLLLAFAKKKEIINADQSQ